METLVKRIIGFLSLATLMVFFAVEGYAQVREKDKVERRDKKGNTVTVTGQIVDESPAGIKLRFEGKAKEEVIPAGDIQRVIYGDFTVNVLKSVAGSNQAERDRNFPALVKTYEDIQAMPDLRTASAQTRRYIDYRLAQTRAGAAETDEQVKAAIKGLQDFIAANANSWERSEERRVGKECA